MYGKNDYLKRGLRFVNNNLRPGHKKLSSLMFYATDMCNSGCLHCRIWEKRPPKYLTFEEIVKVMGSNCITKDTTVGMEGGEFLLHPEADKILEWFSINHPNYDLLSNCLIPTDVINAVEKYHPNRLYISLDGDKHTYKYMRGKDGYDNVITVIEKCKSLVPISLMFTLTPYNSFKDLEHVIEVSKKHDLDIRIGIYNNIDFFDTKDLAHKKSTDENAALKDIDSDFTKTVPEVVKSTTENYDFLLLYEQWRNNNLKLKCHSILDSLVIHPNGDVPICQNLSLKLGNVKNNSLDEIFNSTQTINLHKKHTNSCNKCWINYHRKYDVVLLRSAEKIMPKRMVEAFYGKYQWTDNPKLTYKKHFSN